MSLAYTQRVEGLFILPYSLDEDQTSSSLCVLRELVCLCECVSILSVPVQVCRLRYSSAPLFFLNVIVECSSEMNLHTCIITEGNTIGYILLTPPCRVLISDSHFFFQSSSLQLDTNTLRV